MTISTDIQGLQEITGTSFGDYHEIVSDEKSVNCQARWPLLAQTHSTLTGVTAVKPSVLTIRGRTGSSKTAPILAVAPTTGAEVTISVHAEPVIHSAASAPVLVNSTPLKLAIEAGSRFAAKRTKHVFAAPVRPAPTALAVVPRHLVGTTRVSASPALPVLMQVVVRPAPSSVHPLPDSAKTVVAVGITELADLFRRLEAPQARSFAFNG
jgi:hypothetical protein